MRAYDLSAPAYLLDLDDDIASFDIEVDSFIALSLKDEGLPFFCSWRQFYFQLGSFDDKFSAFALGASVLNDTALTRAYRAYRLHLRVDCCRVKVQMNALRDVSWVDLVGNAITVSTHSQA